MKTLNEKDLLLSPQTVSDLTGNGDESRADKAETDVDCRSVDNQCLSEDDNPCASDECTNVGCQNTDDEANPKRWTSTECTTVT